MLNPAAGRTATELAGEAGRALPDLADELDSATTAFNDVTYGNLEGTQTNYGLVSDLDDRVRALGRISGTQGADR